MKVFLWVLFAVSAALYWWVGKVLCLSRSSIIRSCSGIRWWQRLWLERRFLDLVQSLLAASFSLRTGGGS